MSTRFLCLVAAIAAATLLVVGCSQPSSTPTTAPAVPTKAAEPAKGAEAGKAPDASQPTSVSEKKTDYPQKGKAVTVIMPFAAGGANDFGARFLSSLLEKNFGSPFQIENKVGANGQIGTTALAKAKPDGYTLGAPPVPAAITAYLDPENKASFTRKDLVPIALHTMDPVTVAVSADSPYKTVKDLVDAAKANPEGIKAGTAGFMNTTHLGLLDFQNKAGVKFAIVHFEGGSTQPTALLGKHIDVAFDLLGSLMPQVKSGDFRVLGIMDNQPLKFLPGVKTLEEQGYKVYAYTARGWVAPSGTPKEIMYTLSTAIKKVMDTPEHQQKMDELAMTPRYMDTAKFTAFWDEMESQVQPLVKSARSGR